MKNRLSRVTLYIWEMFPPHILILAGFAKFFAVYLGLQALHGDGPVFANWASISGAVCLTLFLLLLRVYDELKDADADIRLGTAGDPRYKDRPIVTGAVKIEDIIALRWGITTVLILLHVAAEPLVIATFAAVFFILWLSFKWFFWAAIKDNLLLALVTHNPLTIVLLMYVFAVFFAQFIEVTVDAASIMLLIVGIWMPLAAWELSRKQRIPEDETDYQTYTKILGMKIAPLAPVVFILISVMCLVSVSARCGLSLIYPAILIVIAIIVIGGYLRFWLFPTSKNSKLQPFTELFILTADIGLLLTIALERGVSWT
ncbi:MAG: hypothetical protein CMM74_15005 [Rhodospirillaceae bacterium]|jgi:4-hydroxybenzoate polyprenyltransferase|nr:hypothetical protein [Rhodospirillaceae bacterium]